MVSYYNPLAMYRHQQQSPAPPPGPQFHPHQGPGAAAHGWYSPPAAAAYHPQPPPQQFLSPCQEEPWHHHAAHHMFQPEWGGGGPGGPGGGTPDFAAPIGAGGVVLEEPQLPSPPITVSSSELSSPGAALSPPQHRPMQVRSPFEWMKKPSYQSQPNPGKTRTKDKYRVVYSDHQRLELEKEFHYSRYITIRRKAELAANLGLSERQVKIWFQNRRAKERKQVKKREELLHKEKLDAVQQLQHHQLSGPPPVM